MAPARAWDELGGIGTHRSSQISTPTISPSTSAAANRRSVPKGTVCAAEDDVASAAAVGGRGEPAALVKLLVIGQERLGHDAEQPAAMQHGGAVEELIVDGQRQADDGEAGEDAALPWRDASSASTAPRCKRGLVEQIGAGVAGERQLGEDEDGDLLALGPAHQGEDVLGVEGTVGDAQQRRGGGDAEETVGIHGPLSPRRIAEQALALSFYGSVLPNKIDDPTPSSA